MASLGSAFVQVFPVMKGFRRTIEGEMSSAGGAGASKLSQAFSKAAPTIGKGFGSSLSSSVVASYGDMGKAVIAKLEKEASRAELALSKAKNRAADAAGKVRVAEAQLNEARKSENTVAIVRAEERYASALRTSTQAAAEARAKQLALTDARANVASAKQTFMPAVSTDAGLSGVAGKVQAMAAGLSARVAPGLSALRSTFSDTFHAVGGMAAAAGGVIATGIVGNLGNAVSRVDTLNNFPRVMQNLGYAGDEAAASIKQLVNYFDAGLPGSLDDMATAVQKFAPIMQGMGASLADTTTFTTALNNALLAGGKGSEAAASGMEQYSQMLATGKVDLQSWSILQRAMPGQLNQIAKAMLGAEANSAGLFKALQSGEVSLSDMNDAIVRLNTEGVSGFASFSQQAQDATSGIGTAWSKLQTGFAKAGESIIKGIGVERITSALQSAKAAVEAIGVTIGSTLGNLMNGSGLGGVFSGLAPAIGGVLGMLGPLLTQLPLVGSLFTSLTGPVGIVIGLFVAMYQNSEPLRMAIAGIAETFVGLGGQMSGVLGPALQSISGVVATLAGALGDFLAGALNAVMPLVPALSSFIQAAVPPVMAFIGVIAQVASYLLGVLSPAISKVIGFFASLVASVVSWAASFISTVSGAVSTVVGFFTSLPGRIRGALAGAGSWLVGVGRNIVQGLTNGIRSAIGGVVSAITGGLGSAISKAKAFLGIGSPSKVMAAQIGRWIPPGVAMGVEAATPEMLRSVNSSLGQIEDFSYQVPVNYARGVYGLNGITPNGAGAGAARGAVTNNINVYAADPASVAEVINQRTRVSLGA